MTKKTNRKALQAITGQAQLLIEVIENHGKIENVCKLTGLTYSLVAYWRTDGHVPIARVGQVARALDESIYAFNYEQVAELLGKAPKWEDVVKGCKLSANKTAYVLSKPAPYVSRDVLVK